MKHLRAIRSFAIATLVLGVQLAGAADDCEASPDTWQPRSAVHALADRNCWQIDKLKIDDGCDHARQLGLSTLFVTREGSRFHSTGTGFFEAAWPVSVEIDRSGHFSTLRPTMPDVSNNSTIP